MAVFTESKANHGWHHLRFADAVLARRTRSTLLPAVPAQAAAAVSREYVSLMTTRTHHLRYVALCAGLLLALAVVAWVEEEVSGRLWNALAITPFVFAGTFLFNRFQRSREGALQRKKEIGRAHV